MNFTHLHVHSQFSLLDGKASVQELVDKAVNDGMKGLALTDHGSMFGIKEFYNYVAKKNSKLPDDKKLKPILGCEVYVAKEKMTDKLGKHDNGEHLILLAKNKQGYKNLIKIVSKAWTDGFYFHPRTDREQLQLHHEGLIVCSACLGGEVPQFIMNGDLESAEKRALWYKSVFGDDYYLELQRHQTFKQNSNTDVYPEQQKVNKVLIDIARKHGIKLVATNDVHFTYEDDAEAHDRLICVSMQRKYNEPRMHYTKQEWLKTPEEMAKIFADIPEAIENTMEIYDKVETYSIDHAPIMPFFDIPAEFGTEEQYRAKYTEQDLFNEFTRDENGNVTLSEEEAKKKIDKLGGYDKLYRIKLEADYLSLLTMEGAKKRYGNPVPADVEERLRFELHIMKTMGFPGYFLIVQDFINTGREKLGVSIGPGRGSAAGSAAAYCLGITQIDPIKYDLLFERFLNPDRISLPDIDVDFDDDGRYRVLNYVTEKYGVEKVAHIITYSTMATKSAIRDVGKVMDLSVAETNRLAKLIKDRLPDVNGESPKINFANCLKYDKEFEAETRNPDERVRETMKYAQQLEGNIRGTGVHACGLIICRDDITDWVPVSMGTDSDGSKVISTQYEGSVIEETGLIKMDFLGLRTLSIIMETIDNIKHTRGIDVDIDNIPLDDAATFKLYSEGRTTGTFQFESPGMQQSLRELQPSRFEDLIAMNALYRPGPMDYIPLFIARKHGREPIEYDIPIMKQYLEETYGVTVYQEQVMLLSRLLANFTRGESDVLRKAMGKKQKAKMEELKVKFLEGGKANGHKPEVLEKIWKDWEKFASYAFNKSHATCYSWVAYQTAYLKANYPAEYMAGVLSRNLNDTAKLKRYMDECKRMGINVKGPDVNESVEKFGVNSKGEIRFGLAGVKGVGGNTVKAIITERKKNGSFRDIYDFVERVNLSYCNRSAIEALAMAGAFDCFAGLRREMIVHEMFDSTWADCLVKYGQRFQEDRNSLQDSLFGDLEPIETARPPMPQVEPWSQYRLLEEEKKMVTIYLSGHPLDPYYMEVVYGANTSCDEFSENHPQGYTMKIAGLITEFSTRTTKKGNPYGYLEIEDYTGKAIIRLFGRNYEEFQYQLRAGLAVMLEFEFVERRYRPGEVDMQLKTVTPLEELKGKIANTILVQLETDFTDATFTRAIMDYDAKERPGKLILELYNPENRQTITVRSKRDFPVTKDFVAMLESYDLYFKVM